MTWPDRARGAYVRSPRWVRQTLRPLMGLVPMQLKFGQTYRAQRNKIARGDIDPAFAADTHLASLRALLKKAHQGSPFYRDLIETAFEGRFDSASISLDDIGRMPILDKAALTAAGTNALAVPLQAVDRAQTSGSNAEAPFEFYLDKDRSSREIAFVNDVWSRSGYSEKDARVCLRGFGLASNGMTMHDWDPALRQLQLSVFPLSHANVSTFLDLIDDRGVQYIYGYPSAIYLFCQRMQALGRRPKLPIKGIMPISEPLFEHQRRFISQCFGNPHFAIFYGLSEKALFAAEVPDAPGQYDFNPLYGLAELVDDDGISITEVGREGRLVGTGFLSTGMPFIRYETGDSARLVQLPTTQNGQRLRVADLTPRRKPNYLVSRDGARVVTTDLTKDDPRFYEGIAEFQFYQDEPGEVVLRYALSETGRPEDAERMAGDLDRLCHNRLHFQTAPVDCVATGRNGKRAFIDQRLDIARY